MTALAPGSPSIEVSVQKGTSSRNMVSRMQEDRGGNADKGFNRALPTSFDKKLSSSAQIVSTISAWDAVSVRP
jgi:hypothetical protein